MYAACKTVRKINCKSNDRLRHEIICRSRIYISKKLGNRIRSNVVSIGLAHSRGYEGFTVIGESRGSQDNLSSARPYILAPSFSRMQRTFAHNSFPGTYIPEVRRSCDYFEFLFLSLSFSLLLSRSRATSNNYLLSR
jgi:hypothetical protein